MQSLRICFAGTPEFAAGHLEALIHSPHEICAVYTQPDRPSGRGKRIQPSPVKTLALAHNLPIYQPATLRDKSAQREMAEIQPDVLIVVAYGLILPEAILSVPAIACLNVHASLLPRWRGAAPIERSLLAGDKQTGVTIMLMDKGLDTGPMLRARSTPIGAEDTRESLETRLKSLGRELLLEVLENLDSALAAAQQQDESKSSYADKLQKEESAIDWTQSAEQIDRQIRATIGRHPAFTLMGDQRIRLLKSKVLSSRAAASPGTIVGAERDRFIVATGTGILAIYGVQLPGKRAMSVREIGNARPDLFGEGGHFTVPDQY